MKFRELLQKLEEQREIRWENHPISLKYELAANIYKNKEMPVIFSSVKESSWKAIAGVCSQRKYLAMGMGIQVEEMLPKLAYAFEHPTKAEIIEKAACQEEIMTKVDLTKLPIPHFFPNDGGPYVTAGIMIVKDPETGLNASYHRLMRLSPTSFAIRMVEGRQAHTTYHKCGCRMDVAVCLGNTSAVMLASSMSPASGVFELDIANTLDPTQLVRCKTKDLLVPADCEVVMEGHVTEKTTVEGPFVDLTGTYDILREQPILEIDCITYRHDPLFQVLLPGQNEHKLLMGMPKEPTIFALVNKVVSCKDVVLTSGGGCWLHAAIQIHKKHPEDGKKAIMAALEGHKSVKHVIVVDEDIDIHNAESLEWALATRFQGYRGLVVLDDQPSSSLDPSARHTPGQKSKTTKLGFDATIPDIEHPEKFKLVPY